MSQLVDEHVAAKRLNVSVAFLRADLYRGHVGGRTPGPPFYRIGTAVRYDLTDLEKWLETRRVDRSAAPPAQSQATVRGRITRRKRSRP